MAESILFLGALPPRWEGAFRQDLNLDQLVEEVCLGHRAAELEDLFCRPVSVAEQAFRQAVFRELARPALLELVRRFVRTIQTMEERLALEEKLTNPMQRQWYRVRDLVDFLQALRQLEQDLEQQAPQSRGMQVFLQCLRAYWLEGNCPQVLAQGQTLLQELEQLPLRLRVSHNVVEVLEGRQTPDYSRTLAALFAGFRDRETRDYTYDKFVETRYLNRVEEQVAAGAAALAPDLFQRLEAFAAAHPAPISPQLKSLCREWQFYLAYAAYVEPLRQEGLPFCCAEPAEDRRLQLEQCFDLVLAHRLKGDQVVCNDFTAAPQERQFLITGANQGGKTTYARMVGQVLYLAALGVPVPGRRVQVCQIDRILTHFEREETVDTEHGKLMEDLQRLHGLLEQATDRSLLLMNETFSSTTLEDAVWLAEQTLARVRQLDCLCLYVTFLGDRLASLPQIVCLRSKVGPQGERTYRMERAGADGRAYAQAMARRHGLQYEQIMERVKP